jgi:maleylpyruvate isomerase
VHAGEPPTLHGFFRSGTSHRVRIALRLKGLHANYRAVDLRRGEHADASYRAIHPQGLVPALVHQGRVLIQSPAILEWLEETHPTPPLLPRDVDERARVRAVAAIVACDVHPLNNRRVLEALRSRFGAGEEAVTQWCARWIGAGFDAIEALLPRGDPPFCFGDAPTLADVCLVPQVESARRFGVDLARWPRILAVDAACARLEAFRFAAPALQPDAP